MFSVVFWALITLSCVNRLAAQNLEYSFTMGVTSPAPTPGEAFTITWTGGEATELVYIVLNYYFADAPSEDIVYIKTDILSDAPNNGSWVYHMPLDIISGRYSFSIGYNPLQLSATSGIFTIVTSYIPPPNTSTGPPSATNTAAQTYNFCGLPPLPDYTYTGYQPPCTKSVSGVLETLYPIVPSSDSSLFFSDRSTSSNAPVSTTTPTSIPTTSPTSASTSASAAFATGIYAQALQCPVPVTPTATTITIASTATVFSLVDCASSIPASITSSPSSSAPVGVCHTSGYTTFSVSGTSSVCCPDGWSTTPLNSELFCFTSVSGNTAKRGLLEAIQEKRQASKTVEQGSGTVVQLQGLAFTTAGIVEAQVTGTGTLSASGKGSATTTAASSTVSKKSEGRRLNVGGWMRVVGSILGIGIVAV